jgi:hypothetical protein
LSSNIPQLNALETLIIDADTFLALKGIGLGYYSITLEVRFFLGKKGFGKGFYLAPFYRHSNYTPVGLEFEFDNENLTTSKMNTSGNLSGNTFGLLIGS